MANAPLEMRDETCKSTWGESVLKFGAGCLCFLCVAVQLNSLVYGQAPNVPASEFTRLQSSQQPVGLDVTGDPLPHAALLRFGTLRFVHPAPVADMALSPDGKSLLTWGGTVMVCWNSATGAQIWQADVEPAPELGYGIRGFAFPEDGEFFYSQSGPEKLLKWSIATGKFTSIAVKHALPLLPENRPANSFPGTTRAVDVTRDGSLIAAAGGHGVAVYDASGKSLLEIPNTPLTAITPADWQNDRMLFGGHYSLAQFSPDGRTLAVVTSDAPHLVRLFDSTSGEKHCQLELSSRVVRMAFSPDGSSLATTERCGAVGQYRTATGERQWEQRFANSFSPPSHASAIAYSPDGQRIAAAASDKSHERIYLLNTRDGAVHAELKGHQGEPVAFAFSIDSKQLYSAGLDRVVRRWDLDSNSQLPPPLGVHVSGVVATTANSNQMAFVDDLGNVHVWETPRGNSAVKETVKETVQFRQPFGNIELLALSSDGRFVAGGSSDGDELHVSLWDLKRGELMRGWKWPRQENAICRFKALEFSPDGNFIAAAVAGKGKAFLLRTVADEQVAELEHESICALAFDRTGRQLVTAGTDQRLRFWKGDTGELLQTQEMGGGTLHNVRFSPVQDLLVTAHLPNVLRLWNMADMSLKSRTTLSGEANLEALGFSPNGNWLATGSSGQVIVIDARTGEAMWRAGSHRGRVLSLGFADAGKVLVSGGNDGVGYCWDLMLPDQNAVHDFDKIWSELRDGSDVDVKSLLWRLMKIGDPAVAEVERRLQPVLTIVSVRAITKGLDPQAAEHRIRLATKLCESNPKFELDSRLKYAIDFLKQLRNPKSVDLLKQLATHHPSQAVRKEAMFALEEIE